MHSAEEDVRHEFLLDVRRSGRADLKNLGKRGVSFSQVEKARHPEAANFILLLVASYQAFYKFFDTPCG